MVESSQQEVGTFLAVAAIEVPNFDRQQQLWPDEAIKTQFQPFVAHTDGSHSVAERLALMNQLLRVGLFQGALVAKFKEMELEPIDVDGGCFEQIIDDLMEEFHLRVALKLAMARLVEEFRVMKWEQALEEEVLLQLLPSGLIYWNH